ncbi:hypothetical protein Tco_0401488 [Tanacetum coccineum]
MALILSVKDARYITYTSPLIRDVSVGMIFMNSFIFRKASSASAIHHMVFLSVQLLSALKIESDFSAFFEMNQLSAANFPLRLCTSLSVLGGSRLVTALTLEGLALIPCLLVKGLLNILQHAFLRDTLDYHVINVTFEVEPDLIIGYLIDQPLFMLRIERIPSYHNGSRDSCHIDISPREDVRVRSQEVLQSLLEASRQLRSDDN